MEQRNDVVPIVEHWFLYRLSYRFTSGKVNDCLNVPVLFNQFCYEILITEVIRIKFRIYPAYLFYTLQHFFLRIRQVIHYHNLITLLNELNHGIGSDEPGTTG